MSIMPDRPCYYDLPMSCKEPESVRLLFLQETVAVFNHDNANKFGGWEALERQGIENLRGRSNNSKPSPHPEGHLQCPTR
jgi:hypothetical protein